MFLNKKGWSLREMLLLSGVLLLFLIIAIFYIFRLYNSFGEEASVSYYYDLEDRLENNAKTYLSDYYTSELTNDEIIISRNVLRNYNLDVDLKDSEGNVCSGYVKAFQLDDDIIVSAYIKCPNYTTNGYED